MRSIKAASKSSSLTLVFCEKNKKTYNQISETARFHQHNGRKILTRITFGNLVFL